MKKVLLVLLMCLPFLGASADGPSDEPRHALVIWYENEEIYRFLLDNEPTLTVEDGNAVIQSDDTYYDEEYQQDIRLYYSVPISESSKYRLTFEKRSSQGYVHDGIQDVQGVHPQFSLKGNQLQVMGQKSGEKLNVYTTDGKLVGSARTAEDGTARVAVPVGKHDALVIKSGKANFKILSK